MSLSFLSAVRRFFGLAAVALVVMLMAGPVWAQTTVTSNGRVGQTTCVGQAEVGNMPITALSTSSVTVTAPQVTWSQVTAPLGDGQAPLFASIYVGVYNGRTGVLVNSTESGVPVMTISSGTDYAGGSLSRTGLAARTPYYVEVRAVPQGRPVQVLARRCFMTGGTYTMTVAPATGQTSGCFSISPLTQQHVRNCLCGRGNNSPRVLGLFTNETQNVAVRAHNGCIE
ncbi:MAG: hypothetical protein OXC93_11535 [Rhodospirillaceae bacterium]|nr:hypothetical protein [Rhodospirillaceae bacterium]